MEPATTLESPKRAPPVYRWRVVFRDGVGYSMSIRDQVRTGNTDLTRATVVRILPRLLRDSGGRSHMLNGRRKFSDGVLVPTTDSM